MKDDDVEKETIKLYDLNFGYKKELSEDKDRELKNKKEEDLSKNKYYKIEEKKLEELEKSFKQLKTKIKLNYNLKILSKERVQFLPKILFNIKKAEKNKNIIIVYDEKYFTKLIEIEISGNILMVEKLENNDLIFLVEDGNEYEILVYRLIPELKKEKKKFVLSQKIKETIEGYKIKYKKNKHHYFDKDEPIMYNLYYIKAISGNRFFCASNYGLKIYALNEKNEYELVLLEPYDKIDFIYEIDKNKFIFGLNLRSVHCSGFCGNSYTCHYNLKLNKIELKNIDKTENKFIQENYSDNKEPKDNEKNNDNLDILKVREKLKFSFVSQEMFEFNHSSGLINDRPIYFSDFVTLKNKYFIIMLLNNILVFNMENGKIIKKFEIIADHKYLKMDIKKWDCTENDEFILIARNNIILFKLNEENSSKVSLNVLNYVFFPELIYKENHTIKGLKKINSQKNKFYCYDDNSNDISIY